MKIKIKGRVFEVEEVKGFEKFRGLMFRRNSKPLLFKFKKPTRQRIHSYFCKPFCAIWMKNGIIIEERMIKPFTFSIRPKKPFTELVEIPKSHEVPRRRYETFK